MLRMSHLAEGTMQPDSRESGGQLPNGHRTFATAFPFVVDAKSTYWNDLSLLPKQLSVMYVFFSCMCILECVFHVCVFVCDLCQNCVLAVQCWQSFDRRCVGELCVGRVQCWQSSCVAEFSVGRVQCWQKFQCCLCVCRVPVLQISNVGRVLTRTPDFQCSQSDLLAYVLFAILWRWQ